MTARPGGEPGSPRDGLAGQRLTAVRELGRQGGGLVQAFLVER